MRPAFTHSLFFGISIMLLFSQSACKKNSAKYDYIIFGKYYGECSGNCAKFFRLTDNKLYGDRMDSYIEAKDIKFKQIALDGKYFDLAKSVNDSLPDFFNTEPGQTIGCPDCLDQGGMYLEIHRNGSGKVFKIDPELRRMSKDIMDYITLLQQTIDNLPD